AACKRVAESGTTTPLPVAGEGRFFYSRSLVCAAPHRPRVASPPGIPGWRCAPPGAVFGCPDRAPGQRNGDPGCAALHLGNLGSLGGGEKLSNCARGDGRKSGALGVLELFQAETGASDDTRPEMKVALLAPLAFLKPFH